MAAQLDRLTDPEIVAVSEEADRLIVQLQRMHIEEQNRRKGASRPEEPQALLSDPEPLKEVFE
ncbi:Spo0E family sporulation regulatory protein-aspartic acid phosphatase [Cohnella sp. 56]|uniref:Spo0E family sporulation regulatory protein-aspartic acid phosphatase n=1 Tax=Cohnella sp. 56 TaxID=3113722 RepID=UPI00403FDA70